MKGLRFLAPEVVQTSAMDCGPAALKCLLEGFGIPASYPRLQEACHTDLDGTSINTVEQLAVSLGLDAEQIMLPVDHLLLESASALPALIVVRRDNLTHFLVAWRRHGPLVQLMDPAKGRRWLHKDALRDEVYLHRQRVPADGWRAWAGSPEFLGSVTERLVALHVPTLARGRLVETALKDPSWRGLGLLDASIRMVTELERAGGLKRGVESTRVIETLLTRGALGSDLQSLVPDSYWSVWPDEAQGEGVLVLRGAVLLRVRRRAIQPTSQDAANETSSISPELAKALSERPSKPLAEAWHLLREQGVLTPALVSAALVLAAAGALFEIMLLRGVVEIGNVLSLREHRLVTVGLLLAFVGALLVLDIAIANGILRLGRRLETRLRVALSAKLPRLGDRYFRSRLVSDMAHRAHTIDGLRMLPELAGRFLRTAAQLTFTAIALAWLDPSSAWLALAAAALALAIPLLSERMLSERELRQRNHSAALGRHYLDSLLGLTAARTHSAERALRKRHESVLVEWGRSSVHLLRGGVVVEGFQLLVGSILAAWLVLAFVGRGSQPGSMLLLVYWALNLPVLARDLSSIARQFPAYRNVLARIIEPLSAPDETIAPRDPMPATTGGVEVRLEGVDVRVTGHQILDNVNLTIRAGEHVAVVGRSGAGKSSLVGLLLGWHSPANGMVLVDGERLEGQCLSELRHSTAWVDPAVRLWNRSLFDNLRYGESGNVISSIGSVIETAELAEILEKLPSGLQSPLGEGGGLTSGGEGQRVRFGRALVRHPVRLTILDEPFRGLDRSRRHELLARARELWRDTTLVCVTHDIEDTLSFGRVLVLDGGRIVEDDDPALLAQDPGSLYASLLGAERSVKSDLWSTARWRRWELHDGVIDEINSQVDDSWTTQQRSAGR